jgi:PAS domain S-box-containing protein
MPEAEVSELEALLASKEPEAVLDAVLGSMPSGAIIARAPDGKILRMSDYAARLLGWSRSDVEGCSMKETLELIPLYDPSGRSLPEIECPLFKALRGEIVTTFELKAQSAAGERIPLVTSAAPIRNSRGELIGAISSIADLRPYKALQRDLREAYRELTHRVKNHLQIMTALVTLESRKPAVSAKDLADHMKGQLQALAAVYKSMDRAEAGESIEARPFVEEVCRPYASNTVSVEAAIAPLDLTLASDQAGPIGMLVNEAVCNSRKHAFTANGGHIHVLLRRTKLGRLRLEVADDGVGWGAVDPSEAHHGLDLMRFFAKQLHCELELSDRPQGGAMVAVELPETR